MKTTKVRDPSPAFVFKGAESGETFTMTKWKLRVLSSLATTLAANKIYSKISERYTAYYGTGHTCMWESFSPKFKLYKGEPPRNPYKVEYLCMLISFFSSLISCSLVNQSMPDAPKILAMVRRALSVWENNSKLTFREVYSDQADIQILFAT